MRSRAQFHGSGFHAVAYLALSLACGIFFFSGLCSAGCKHANSNDVPHGANELIELPEQDLAEIRGVVSGPGEPQPTRDVVAEVYRFQGSDNYESLKEATESKRIAACVTGRDGQFSFPYLEPGRYLLRVGMRNISGVNEVYAIVRIQPGARRTKLSIRLVVGT